MKKCICFLLLLSFALSLWGCGGDDRGVTEPSDIITPTATPTVPTDPTEPPACTHAPEIISTIQATCNEPGQTVSSCPLCGEEFTEELPALGHSFTEAGCTMAKTCVTCGLTEGEPLGHDYLDGVCRRCGDALPEDLPTDCNHQYRVTHQTAPTCTQEGSIRYQCADCGSIYEQSVAATGHKYTEATCTAGPHCLTCGNTQGDALGHSYQDGACLRCGAADPDAPQEVTFTVTVRSDKGSAMEGVSVSVYNGGAEPAATGITNQKGTATMQLLSADSYTVKLSNIPSGYSAKESYTFRSTRVNINLTTVSVISPTDHSQANYKVGSTMGDFTLTDTDGNSYNLSHLLKEKDLVILNFWFVNCGPCKAEFPYFEVINEKYDNVQLLTMNHIDSEADIIALREQMGVTFPMIAENIGFQQGFGIYAYPTTVFIAPSGKILKIQVGDFKSQAELEALIDSLI